MTNLYIKLIVLPEKILVTEVGISLSKLNLTPRKGNTDNSDALYHNKKIMNKVGIRKIR